MNETERYIDAVRAVAVGSSYDLLAGVFQLQALGRVPAGPAHRGVELHHITDSDLERYYLGTFQGMELAMLEEHLLWCLSYAHRLTNIEAPYHPN